MRLKFSLFSLLLFGTLQAQEVLQYPFDEEAAAGSVLEFTAEVDYFSDQIENYLIDRMVFGGEIDRERLENMSSNMDSRNIFGGWYSSGIRYRASTDSIKWSKKNSLVLEFGTAGYGFVEFPRDAFHLSFIGNADRLGQKMDMSYLNSEVMNYQYAGLGVMNESTGSFLSFNLINVQNYYRTESRNLTLFTSDLADEIEVNYDVDFYSSDSLKGDFLSNSGTGLTLNGRYNFRVNENNDLVSIGLRNIGFSRLNERTGHFRADSTFYFAGVDVDDLFDPNNPFTSVNMEDSLNTSQSYKAETVLMPADLNASYFHKINKYDHVGFSLRKRFFSAFRPEIGINYIHSENEKVSYNLGAQYGGYGSLRLNAGVFFTSSNWTAFLRTNHLTGAFLNSAKGRSLSFGLSRIFNGS